MSFGRSCSPERANNSLLALSIICWHRACVACGADAGAWVRVKSGLYKGDLAKVVDVNPGEGKATIRLVPRLDLAAIANRRPEDVRANFGKQPKVKPAARPFNPEEVRPRWLALFSGLCWWAVLVLNGWLVLLHQPPAPLALEARLGAS